MKMSVLLSGSCQPSGTCGCFGSKASTPLFVRRCSSFAWAEQSCFQFSRTSSTQVKLDPCHFPLHGSIQLLPLQFSSSAMGRASFCESGQLWGGFSSSHHQLVFFSSGASGWAGSGLFMNPQNLTKVMNLLTFNRSVAAAARRMTW